MYLRINEVVRKQQLLGRNSNNTSTNSPKGGDAGDTIIVSALDL